MKAVVLNDINKDVEIQTCINPDILNSGEAIVKLLYAALNHRDVWIQKGKYASIKLPVILGSDGCGEVVEINDISCSHFLSKKVIINPGMNWGPNATFQSKEFSILGMPTDGTFAEFVKVQTKYLYEKPEHLTDLEAAAIPLAGVTAYRALFTQGNCSNGQRILVTGIGGGVALWAMQLAIANSNDVWVTSGDDEKIEQAIALGAIGGVNYNNEKWWEELQKQNLFFDIIIESACGKNFEKLIDLCNPAAKIVLYGGTLGDIEKLIPAKIFWKQISIIGSTMGSDIDFKNMMQFINDKKVKPFIKHVYSLNDAQKAMDLMNNGNQFGKIILKIEE